MRRFYSLILNEYNLFDSNMASFNVANFRFLSRLLKWLKNLYVSLAKRFARSLSV